MKVEITEAFIANNLVCPPDRTKIEFVHSGSAETRGWYLECARGLPGRGIHRFRFKCATTHKTRHLRIGSTTEISLLDAMAKAREYRRRLDAGLEPVVEEKPRPTMPTLAEYFDDSYYPYISSRNRGAKKTKQIFDLRIRSRFGNLRLDEISRQQIQIFHTSLLQHEGLAHSSANHHLRLLKTMYRRAIDWELTTANPAARITLFREDNKIENYMNQEQLSKLLEVLATYPARNACNVAMFLLATGARLNEALNATWANIDRERRTWRIPAANSKSKKVRSVRLSQAAIDVLDQLGSEGKHEYLFVKKNGERFRYLHQVWNRIRNKAGMPWLRLHDLRHQHASMLVNSGYSLYIVMNALGHQSPDVAQRYSHLSTETMQDAAESVSAAISGARERAG